MDDVNDPIAFSGRELQGKSLAETGWRAMVLPYGGADWPVSPTLPPVRFAHQSVRLSQYLLHRDLTRIAQQDDIGLLPGASKPR